MSETVIYGIKNCDTMKKAFKWLDAHNIDFTFHDYKKQGVDEGILRDAITKFEWETVINRRGTTWRNLPEDVKNTMNETTALKIAKDTPAIVKRPLLVHNGEIYLGFKGDDYTKIFTP